MESLLSTDPRGFREQAWPVELWASDIAINRKAKLANRKIEIDFFATDKNPALTLAPMNA
jgi:hypothetical protein